MAPRNQGAHQAVPTPEVPATPEVSATPETDTFTFQVGDYASGKHRASSKVPDEVADLLEELRTAHGLDVTDGKQNAIPAGTVKFRTVTVANEAAGDTFAKHVRSYSKTVMYPEWSARLSRMSDTAFRVGVGPVKPKPRRAKTTDATDTAADQS